MRKNKNRHVSKRLGCESLEDRRVLAVVTSAADAGAGSLRDALATGDPTITFDTAAMGSTTISLTSGELLVTGSVSIDGGAGVTIDAGGNSRVMYIDDGLASYADVELRNLTITGGNGVGMGGVEGGGIQGFENLLLENVTVSNNTVVGVGTDGGGIGHGNEGRFAGDLTIIGSSIVDNAAEDDASALDFYNGRDLVIRDTEISRNVSGDATKANAGAVGPIRVIDLIDPQIVAQTDVTIDNLTMADNSIIGVATAANLIMGTTGANMGSLGTAILFTNGFVDGNVMNVTLENSEFTNNLSLTTDADDSDEFVTTGSGAIDGGSLTSFTMRNTTVTGNSAAGAGGGVNLDTSNVTISDSVITGNTSGGGGGGLALIVNPSATVTNTDISGNYSGGRGGGVYLTDNDQVELENLTIDSNYAYEDGGGMVIAAADVVTNTVVRDVTITNNGDGALIGATGKSGAGGGVWVIDFVVDDDEDPNTPNVDGPGTVTATFEGTTISGNTAFNGAGIMVQPQQGRATVDIVESTVDGNVANNGAIADANGVEPDDAGWIPTYSGTGGGIWVPGRVDMTITDSTISNNDAGFEGGGIEVDSGVAGDPSTLTLINSTVSGNSVEFEDQTGAVPAFNVYIGGGGGIWTDNGVMTTLIQSTVTGNSAPQGGGIKLAGYNSSYGRDYLDLQGSIVSGNSATSVLMPAAGFVAGDDIFDVDGAYTYSYYDAVTASFSIIGNGDGTVLTEAQTPDANGNLIGSAAGGGAIDAMLGALADNGGPTLTHLPQAGSPVIDAGDPGFSGSATDQRGAVRVSGAAVDMGSVEFGSDPPVDVTCDFSGDGMCDCTDVDLLTTEVASGDNNPAFDLTGDGLVNLADRDQWLADAGAVNNASGGAYLLGDINLDGFVDVSDRNIWNQNKFTATPEWCSGDVNMDGFIDVSDLNIWNTFKFMSSDSAATLTIDVKPGVMTEGLDTSVFEVAAAKPTAELPLSDTAPIRGLLDNTELSSTDDASDEETSVVDSVFAEFDVL